MSVRIDARRLTDAIVRLQAACDGLSDLAETARSESLGHMILGVNANVYATAPGKRPRTGELREGLDARARATRNTVTVEVIGTAAHTLWVELGREGMSIAALQAMAASNPNPYAPITLGRSGVNYTKAGPIMTPAQAFALYRMRELFAQKVRGAL